LSKITLKDVLAPGKSEETKRLEMALLFLDTNDHVTRIIASSYDQWQRLAADKVALGWELATDAQIAQYLDSKPVTRTKK